MQGLGEGMVYWKQHSMAKEIEPSATKSTRVKGRASPGSRGRTSVEVGRCEGIGAHLSTVLKLPLMGGRMAWTPKGQNVASPGYLWLFW